MQTEGEPAPYEDDCTLTDQSDWSRNVFEEHFPVKYSVQVIYYIRNYFFVMKTCV